MRRQPLDQRDKARIDKEQPVCGVIDNVENLLIKKSRVDRVADCSDARERVIEFEVAKSIPGESADSVAASDPHPLQCASQLLGPAFRLVVGIAVDSALDGSRDDFRFGMIDSRML